MTNYADAAKKIAAAQDAAAAAAVALSGQPAIFPALSHVGDAGIALKDASEKLAQSLPKPLPTGLWTRDNPVSSRSYDPAFPGFIGRLNWRDLEPAPGQFDSAPIDRIRANAKARGKVTAIRFYSGAEGPDWAKAMGGGPVHIYNPTDQKYADVGLWWNKDYQQAWATAVAYIATQIDDDPLFLMFCDSLGGMLYPEPFLRSLGHTPTWNNLHAAGLTTELDHAALIWAARTCAAAFRRTRTFLSFNPGQNFDTRKQDLSWSDEMTEKFRTHLGDRGVFYSTSLDAQADKPAADQHVYQKFVEVGGPRAIQTEQTGRVSNWDAMMKYGISLGFHMVECSPGGWETKMTVAQAQSYSTALAANAKGL